MLFRLFFLLRILFCLSFSRNLVLSVPPSRNTHRSTLGTIRSALRITRSLSFISIASNCSDIVIFSISIWFATMCCVSAACSTCIYTTHATPLWIWNFGCCWAGRHFVPSLLPSFHCVSIRCVVCMLNFYCHSANVFTL